MLTPEQTKKYYETQRGSETPLSPVEYEKNLSVITADDLTTTQEPYDVKEPAPTTPTALPEYKPMELTEPEKEVSAAQKRIAELRSETLGESEQRAILEQERGVEAKTQAITDLEAEYDIIKAEQLGLKEQQRMIPLQMQEEARGRGITVGGLRPLETGRLRMLAIRQEMTTSKGLFKLAELQGARGSLSTAMSLVDRAVDAEFDPIKEKLEAELDNLDMLLASPELSLADKNRAEKMKVRKEAGQERNEEMKEEKTAIGKVVVEAASLGANAMDLREISEATTANEALAIAMEKGIDFGAMERAKLASQEALTEQRLASAEKAGRIEEAGLQPSVGFFDTKIESSVREDANQLLMETPDDKAGVFNTLRRLYSPQEATDEALKQVAGIKPEPIIEPTIEDTAESWLEEKVSGTGFWGGLKELVLGDTTTEEKEQLKSKKEAKKDLKRLERDIKFTTGTTKNYIQKQIDDIKSQYNL